MKTVDEMVLALQEKTKTVPSLVCMLGTGWNAVIEAVEDAEEMSYGDVFGVETGVPGHSGKFIIGTLAGKKVGFMVGRFHLYEGYTAEEATRPLVALQKLGMKKIVLTAATGALNEKYAVGDFVINTDFLTLFLKQNPLVGAQFIDTSELLSKKFQLSAQSALVKTQAAWHEGVYAYYPGPSFETPADKMALRHLGADVVGMSSVPEALRARSLQVDILSLSFVTNLAFVYHDHHDVLAAAQKAEAQMSQVLTEIARLEA